jgi:hypothetical protein
MSLHDLATDYTGQRRTGVSPVYGEQHVRTGETPVLLVLGSLLYADDDNPERFAALAVRHVTW